jgi:hypothetical protein
VTGLGAALRSLVVVAVERATNVDLILREPALLVAANVSLVAGVRLDQFSLPCHGVTLSVSLNREHAFEYTVS